MAAIVPTLKTSGATNPSAESMETAELTFATGKVYYLFVAYSDGSAGTPLPTAVGGPTWVAGTDGSQAANVTTSGDSMRLACLVAVGGGETSTVVVTWTGRTIYREAHGIVEWDAAEAGNGGLDSFVSVVVQANQTDAVSLTPAAFDDATNNTGIIVVGHNLTAGCTPDGDWAEILDVSAPTAHGIAIAYRGGEDRAVGYSRGSDAAIGGMAIEIAAAAGAATPSLVSRHHPRGIMRGVMRGLACLMPLLLL